MLIKVDNKTAEHVAAVVADNVVRLPEQPGPVASIA
jgi:hypothetical protein